MQADEIYIKYHHDPSSISMLIHVIYFIPQNIKEMVGKSLCGIKENSLPSTFANRLDPDQARRFVEHDLDPICLTLRWHSDEMFFRKKLSLKNIPGGQKSMKNIPGGKELKCTTPHFEVK